MNLTTDKTKKMRILLMLLALFLSGPSFANGIVGNEYSATHKTREQMGGVYYAYPVPSDTMKYHFPPAGYHPFYISHYGRHGSRWMISDDSYKWINRHFEDKSNLTPLGKNVRKRLQKVWANAKGNGGKLTQIGAQQHRGIADRMFVNFSKVLERDDVNVSARSSIVGRCVASMQAFVDELHQLNPKLNITSESDKRYMNYLVYDSPEMKKLEKRNQLRPWVSTDRFMKALFINPDLVDDKVRLMDELHTVASDMQDVGLDLNLYDLFTDDEFADIYGWNNQRMAINNGDVVLNEGIAARCAIPLWRNIVESADSAIAKDRPSATLRFGHDTILYRLLSFLELRMGDGLDQIVPMAANLQMLFCRNDEGDVIVKFLHNEHEATLPVATDMWPFYHWKDVKTYYERRMERLEHLRQLNAINTMVGTASANTKSAGLFGNGSEEHGQTLPAVLAPNGQNFWTPQTQDTEQKCIAPYYYKDSLFMGIRNSHWIVGGCTQDYGSFTVAAISGKLRTQPEQRATRFSHKDEISHPHYYSVTLPDEHLRTELTATSHCALIRVTPEKDELVHIVLNPNSDYGEGYVRIDTARHLVYGYNPVHRIYQGWGKKAGFSGHFILSYQDIPIESGTFCADDVLKGDTAIGGKSRIGVYLTFRAQAGHPILLRAASSFTDYKGAANNLTNEISDLSFEQVAAHLSNLWTERLHTIDVASDDTASVNQFYGAMYRTSFLPRELSDVDGRYPKFAQDSTSVGAGFIMDVDKSKDSQTNHNSQFSILNSELTKHYTDYSMWDTYRAVHPLYNIIAPTASADMMQSLVDMYAEGGWLPIFPCWNSYTAAMIGDHCSVVLADAYIKGIRNFDYEKAYEGMRKNAFESPASIEDYKNGMGRRALQSYLKYGYIPLEDNVKEAFHQNEQVSRTLEYAFDDFAVAQMAKALGQTADYDALMKRSQNYRNVINPKTGYAQGRYANGKFDQTKDYFHRQSYITEGAPCHYTWYVPQDPQGLITLLGGKKRFTSKLDSMFTCGRYWHGNEPCHQVAYMFDYAGEPWKTQKWVRHILETEYNDTPGGLSGNDDAGQMSAWYIFSAMGFYPVCPATPYYMLSSPTFKSVKINLDNGCTFTIDAENAGKDNIYVQSITKDGKPYADSFITHDDIVNGAKFHFVMSAKHQ
jgi:putative alpha-1,2-mannosidase